MIKILLSQKYLFSSQFQRSATNAFFNKVDQAPKKKQTVQLKPYQKLLFSSIELTPKIPTKHLLKTLRLWQLTRIMISNDSLDHQKVLQAHIECLFSLTQRVQNAIQPISIFVKYIMNIMKTILDSPECFPETFKSKAMIITKPTLLTKFVRIAVSIDHLYDESMRMLLSSFIIKSLQLSRENKFQKVQKLQQLQQLKREVLSGSQLQLQQEDIVLTPDNIESYYQKKSKQYQEKYTTVVLADFLQGSQYILNMGYYTDEFMSILLPCLTDSRYCQVESLGEAILKIRTLVQLQKYQQSKKVEKHSDKLFKTAYPKLLEKYFQLLQNKDKFLQIAQSDNHLIQTQLIMLFLRPEDSLRAKKIYLQVIKKMFNGYVSASINTEIKKLRGIFEVLLIMCTHDDTADIHHILQQQQRMMIFYPNFKFQLLESHCNLAQKHGFKSDTFASVYLEHLLYLKRKIEKNQSIMKKVHRTIRQIDLANKFLTYLNVVAKPTKQFSQKALQLGSSLFMPNIWNCFPQNVQVNKFLCNPSYVNNYHFKLQNLEHLTENKMYRQKIESIVDKVSLKNILKDYLQIKSDLFSGAHGQNTRINHSPFWKHNHHARLFAVLRLSIHHYDFLVKGKKQEQANQFFNQFFNKIFKNQQLYKLLKSNFAYPEIIGCLIKLQARMDVSKYQTFNRDLEVLKRMFSQELIKMPKGPMKCQIEYQEQIQVIQYNRVSLSYYQDLYGFSNVATSASQSLLYHTSLRYLPQKQALKVEIQTFYKFNKNYMIDVVVNYFQYPYLADIKINKKGEDIILFFRYSTDKVNFLNYRVVEMQVQSQKFWIKKGYEVIYLKSQKDIQKFTHQRIKNDKTSAAN